MAPIGEKMKQMGQNIKEKLTPGHEQHTTTGAGTTTYTQEGGEPTGLTEKTIGGGQYGQGTRATEYGAGTGAYTTQGEYATTGATTGLTSDVPATGYAGTTGTGPLGSATREGKEEVLGQEYYTGTEDRPRVKERVEQVREHRPVEKEYVVETRATGRERAAEEQRTAEHLGTRERIVSEGEATFDGSRATEGGEYGKRGSTYTSKTDY